MQSRDLGEPYMEEPEKSKVAAALKQIMFGPFKRADNRRRPLVFLIIMLAILIIGAFLIQTLGLELGGIIYMVMGLSWSGFCRWQKWA